LGPARRSIYALEFLRGIWLGLLGAKREILTEIGSRLGMSLQMWEESNGLLPAPNWQGFGGISLRRCKAPKS
jgi:hypothetical protein